MLKTNLLCPARLRVGLMAVLAMLVGLGSAFAQRPKTANPRQPHVAAQPVERIEPFATPLMLEIQKNALMLSDDQMGRRVIAGCWNGDIMDLASYPPYASFFVDYKRAGNEPFLSMQRFWFWLPLPFTS